MKPWEYWELTPVELGERLEGGVWRLDKELERTAWALAHLLNISGKSLKQDVTPDKLLGRRAKFAPRDPAGEFEVLWSRHVQRLAAEGIEVPEE